MLHARLEIIQVLDHFQTRFVITEIAAGQEPATFIQEPMTLDMPEIDNHHDALSTILALLRLWSERTIQE